MSPRIRCLRMRGKCAGLVTSLISNTSSLLHGLKLDSLEARAGWSTEVKLELPYSISGDWGVEARDHYSGLDRYPCMHGNIMGYYLNFTPTS